MEHAAIRENRNKRNFDARVKIQDLEPGDWVLLKNLGIPGKHKLADWWRPQPYIVCKQIPGLPVCQIGPEGEKGPRKMWHRNHSLPLSDAVKVPHAPKLPPQKPTPPRTSSQKERPTEAEVMDLEDDEFGEDYGYSQILSPVPLSREEADEEDDEFGEEYVYSQAPSLASSSSQTRREEEDDDMVSVPTWFWSEEEGSIASPLKRIRERI